MNTLLSRQEPEEYLKWLQGWKGDTPTKMILTAPAGRQDFWLWRRNRITGEIDHRMIDMFDQHDSRMAT